MRKPWIFFLVLAIGLALYWIKEDKTVSPAVDVDPSPNQSAESQNLIEAEKPAVALINEVQKNEIAKPKSSRESLAQKPRLKKTIPEVEQIRAEVSNDPHSTPISLIQFSLEIGERMDAVKDEQEAADLFRELEDCLVERTNAKAESVQALCLLNARRLSKKYESLKNSYVSLAEKADPKILELSKQVN